MQMTIFYDFFVYLRYRRLAPGNQYLNYIRIMAKVYGAVTIDGQRCKGCDLCVVACPTDVLLLQPKEVNDRGSTMPSPQIRKPALAVRHVPLFVLMPASKSIV